MQKSNLYIVEILGGAAAGMIVMGIVSSVFMARLEHRIEEVRSNQVINSEKARLQREHLELKIDSFIRFNQPNKIQ